MKTEVKVSKKEAKWFLRLTEKGLKAPIALKASRNKFKAFILTLLL